MAKSIRIPGGLNSFDKRSESALRSPTLAGMSHSTADDALKFRQEVDKQRASIGLGPLVWERPEVHEAVGV
jgi:hypothetical protein